jgi:hypothetical protein
MMQHKLNNHDDWTNVPGQDIEYKINERLEAENTRPTEIGGMRVTTRFNGKMRTVEVFSDDYAGRDADIDVLTAQRSRSSVSRLTSTPPASSTQRPFVQLMTRVGLPR